MKNLVKTCGAAYVIAVTVILSMTLVIILTQITHPIIAAVGFMTISLCVIIGLPALQGIIFEPFHFKEKRL